MSRKLFLTIASCVAFAVGFFSLLAPDVLLTSVKFATPNPAALIMARTVGVLLVTIGLLAFLVRGHEDSPTMAAVLKVNLFLQLCLIPIDPLAYLYGTFSTLGSFVPNTVLHVLLAVGFAYYWWRMQPATSLRSRAPEGSAAGKPGNPGSPAA